MKIYKELGVKRVINAIGAWTRIGGSTLTQEVIDAMIDANSCYVEMWELEERAGKVIADLTGAEAAYITSGAFSALVLSVAACMVGDDPAEMKKLPDVSDLERNQVILQECQRYKYDRAITVSGAKMVCIGNTSNCSPRQLESAITSRTAAIVYLAPGGKGAIPIEETIEIAKSHSIPVIVDAPGNIYGSKIWVSEQVYPDEGYKDYFKIGVDLICYGGKYVGAPQGTGYVIGKENLIKTIALHSFVGFEHPSNLYRPLGRGYKLDRHTIVALVTALKNWKEMDHRLRLKKALDKKSYLMDCLSTIPNIDLIDVPTSAIMVGFKVVLLKKSGSQTACIVKELLDGDPRVEVFYDPHGMVRGHVRSEPNSFIVNVAYMVDNDEKELACILKKVLKGSGYD